VLRRLKSDALLELFAFEPLRYHATKGWAGRCGERLAELDVRDYAFSMSI